MKKISMSLMGLALLAILLIAPAAHATSILYTETALDEGPWQYDFTVTNMFPPDDSHPYLLKVSLDFENEANVTLLNGPANWTVGSFIGSLPEYTDYVEMYSDASNFDVLPGGLLTGLSFTADWRLGEITYELWFSDHGTPEDWTTDPITGTASPVPEPATCWLLGFGLIGLAGVCRKTGR